MSEISSLPRFGLALLHPKHWLTWFVLLLFYLFTRLPLSIVDRVASKLGERAYRRNRKRSAFAKTNLTLCFPEKSAEELDDLVRQHFRYHMLSVIHYGLLWWSRRSRIENMIELHGVEHIEQARRDGKQVIALTSHSVGLEFSVAAISMYAASNGPYKAMKNDVINWLVAQGRTRFGVRAYARDDGLRPIIRDTKAGQIMIYLADEDLGADRSVFAPFFAQQKATVPVLGRLAERCDAVVLPCTSCYDIENHRYVVTLSPAIQGLTDDYEVSAARMNIAIEETIMQCLPQYYWTLRLFKTRPSGEASVYG